MATLSHALMGIQGDTTSIHTEAKNTLLQTAFDPSGNEYIYLKGVASTVATDFVTYDELGVTTRLVAGAVGPIAVAMAATVASTWGWYQKGGSASGNAVSTVADNSRVFASATAGRAGDSPVAGDQIGGAIFRSTATANVATVQLDNPRIGMSLEVSGVAVETSANLAPTYAQSGTHFVLDKGTAIAVVLPVPVVGVKYAFSVKQTAAHTITTSASTFLRGTVIAALEATTPSANDGPKMFTGNGTSHTVMTLGTTKGGLVGSYYEFTAVSATVWQVTGISLSSGVIASPFS